MGKKMGNAPVYFTLAQIRFNPVMSLDSYVPSLQESIRRMGYPDFSKTIKTSFNLTVLATGDTSTKPPPTETEALYNFATMDRGTSFILGHNFLTLQTTEYDVFETFSQKLLDVVELFHKTVSLSYVERIGTRYLDAVIPRPGDTLEQYLLPEVTGLSGKVQGTLIYTYSETRVETKAGTTVARTLIEDGPVGFPPDINPNGLTIGKRFTDYNGIHAMLDIDAFHEAREAFDISNLGHHLKELHDEIEAAFQGTVTPHALKVWA